MYITFSADQCFSCLFCLLDFLCAADISRILTGKCKFCKSERIGTVRRCLTGWDQLIRCCNRIMDLRYNFQHKIICQCRHLRPVFDVWSKLDLNRRICHALGIKDTVLINICIKVIFVFAKFTVKFCCRCQNTLICRSCCNGTCIHQCNGRNLTILQLGALTVREVSCRMTD